MVKGGANQLPTSVQQLLNSPRPDLRHLNQLADIVKDGNHTFQANTDLDRGMVKQASTLMNSPFWRAGEGGPGDLNPGIDPTVSNVLSAASPDHQVVHDAMTTGDHDRFLQNLTHHSWQDHGQAVSSLFSWTGDATQGPEARIAGETAHAYSTYIGHHQQDLLNLPGNHTLGQVNPNLVQGMAHGLGPYVDNIAGTTGGLPGFGDSLTTRATLDLARCRSPKASSQSSIATKPRANTLTVKPMHMPWLTKPPSAMSRPIPVTTPSFTTPRL